MDDQRADAVRQALDRIGGVIKLVREIGNAIKVINLLRAADPTLTRAEAGRLVANAYRIKKAVDETNRPGAKRPPPPTAVPIVKIPNPPGPGKHPLIYDITVIIRSPFTKRERRPQWKIPTDRPLTKEEILQRVKEELAETYRSRAHDEWLKANRGKPIIDIEIVSYIRI